MRDGRGGSELGISQEHLYTIERETVIKYTFKEKEGERERERGVR
jgi:hypothetical protein